MPSTRRRPVNALPSDDELKEEARKTLIEVMRSAKKKAYADGVCKECGKRQRFHVDIPDNTNVVKAAGEIIDRLEGKAATKREVPKPITVGKDLEELTDEELEALIHGSVDGGAAEEAA